MMVSMLIIKRMEKEYILFQMESNFKETSKMISSMDKENISIQTDKQ